MTEAPSKTSAPPPCFCRRMDTSRQERLIAMGGCIVGLCVGAIATYWAIGHQIALCQETAVEWAKFLVPMVFGTAIGYLQGRYFDRRADKRSGRAGLWSVIAALLSFLAAMWSRDRSTPKRRP